MAYSHVWWPNIDQDIMLVTQECTGCQLMQIDPKVTPVHPWEYLVGRDSIAPTKTRFVRHGAEGGHEAGDDLISSYRVYILPRGKGVSSGLPTGAGTLAACSDRGESRQQNLAGKVKTYKSVAWRHNGALYIMWFQPTTHTIVVSTTSHMAAKVVEQGNLLRNNQLPITDVN